MEGCHPLWFCTVCPSFPSAMSSHGLPTFSTEEGACARAFLGRLALDYKGCRVHFLVPKKEPRDLQAPRANWEDCWKYLLSSTRKALFTFCWSAGENGTSFQKGI